MRAPALVVAFGAAALTWMAPSVRAQQGYNPATGQIDIEAMKKQLKGMPGGDEAIRQLEAHRADIERSNKIAPAEIKAAADHAATVPEFTKAPLAVLDAVPPAPKSVPEARSRLGKVVNFERRAEKIDGDTKSEASGADIVAWADSISARGIEAQQHPVPLKSLSDEQSKALAELQKAQQATPELNPLRTRRAQALGQLGAEHQAALAKLQGELGNSIGAACEGGEGQVVDQAKCAAVRAAAEAKADAAREAYLKKANVALDEFRKSAREQISRVGPLLAQARKAFGKSMPSAVAGMIQLLDGNAATLIGEVVAANHELTRVGSEKTFL
ncbi:MAG: hypothetical protein HY075_03310 [Deltaproteobacteria bacterium]|nr:hypothetical protein [Deltaproteobacteria bacterium]